MPAITFAQRTRDPATYRVLKRVTLAVVAVWLPLAAWSGYRAIVQIFRLELHAPASLTAGAIIRANVVTSGRTHADLSVELVQGSRTVPLGAAFVQGNSDGALNPLPVRGSIAVTLFPQHVTGWGPGPVTVRVTAVGRSQWLRLPPPTVRETRVSW